jgi:type I restriction enzyme R subunit
VPVLSSFVCSFADTLRDPQAQAEHGNAVDQFLASLHLRETLTDAAVPNEGEFGKLTGPLISEIEHVDERAGLSGQYLYQSCRMRMVNATNLREIGASDERE